MDAESGERTDEAQAEGTIDLGVLDVSQERWTYEQEVVMRMIRQVYEEPRSTRREDLDKWRCWLDRRAFSRLNYLYCARNGDLEANAPANTFDFSLSEAGYGKILVSTATVNKSKFERQLASFRGGDAFNKEFLALVMAGERPPRNIPTDKELRAFAGIQQTLQAEADAELHPVVRDEIILAGGLEPYRFFQVRKHLDTYASVRDMFTAATGQQWVDGALLGP